MAIDVTLDNIASGYNIGKINSNFQKIETALQDAVSRSGSTPNQMTTSLDMNNQSIINVGDISISGGVGIAELVQEASDSATAAALSETNAASSASSAASSSSSAATSADTSQYWAGVAETAAGGGTLKVSSTDTTADYLNNKLLAGSNVSLTKGNPGGIETYTIGLSGVAKGPGSSTANYVPKWNGTDGQTLAAGYGVGSGANNLVQYDGSGNLGGHVRINDAAQATVASASTINLDATTSNYVQVTGTTTINTITLGNGHESVVEFSGALTLTNSGTLILPGGANITTSAGDVAIFRGESSGVRCITYTKANGTPLVSTNNIISNVRQTVLNGDTDTSGKASFITVGSGLVPTFTATNPLVITFANGFNSNGTLDYISRLTSGGNLPTCQANVLSYIQATYASPTSVTWSVSLAPLQEGPAYNQAAQSKLDLNNSILDDFGNSWMSAGATFDNTSPKYAGTYYGVLTGSASSYFKTTAIPSLQLAGNGSFTIRFAFYVAALANAGILMAQNAANYGLSIGITASGKTCLYASSTGSSWDIFSNTNGSGTVTAGAWHDLEFGYDAVAGKYYLDLDGTPDQSVSSTSKLCGITSIVIGAGSVGGSTAYFAGKVQGFEFLPYCKHPAGTTFTPQTTLASFSAAGYASPWWDTTNKLWKTPSAPSGSAGVNPTFTTALSKYVGEVTSGASTISSVVSYAFQGEYVSPWTNGLPGTNTTISVSDNLGTPLKDTKIEALCLTADQGYSVGDIIEPSTETSSYLSPFTYRKLRNSTCVNTGSTQAFAVVVYSSGTGNALNAANWAYRITASRKKGSF